MTRLGAVGAAWRADVDASGAVAPAGAAWSLAWWVNSGDRWVVPGRDVPVRQVRIGRAPVVESLVRVGGGDVAATAFVADGHAVLELANRTPVPVAVAVVVRGSGAVKRLDACRVEVDGAPGVVLPRPPAAAVGGDETGLEAAVSAAPLSAPEGGLGATGAFVFPLPHATGLRCTLPLTGAWSPPPAAGVDAVVRGWEVHARRGVQLALPPGRWAETVELARRSLLLPPAALDPAWVEVADRCGFVAEAVAALGPPDARAATPERITAEAAHWRLTRDRVRLDAVLPSVALGVGEIVRAGRRRRAVRREWPREHERALVAGAALLRAGGHADVAARAEDVLARRPAPDSVVRPTADELQQLVASAGPTLEWEDASTGVALLGATLDLLARDEDAGVVLCGDYPPAWRGQSIDVTDLMTTHGKLGFAVRWHGERPALLWELDGGDPVTLSAPGLDPTWSSREPRGEALLRGGP